MNVLHPLFIHFDLSASSVCSIKIWLKSIQLKEKAYLSRHHKAGACVTSIAQWGYTHEGCGRIPARLQPLSHPPITVVFPRSCHPRSGHLRTTPNPCRTCLGSTRRYRNDVRADGKGSFDERRSMRKRIYDKEGGWERVVKAGDREARQARRENVVG